MPQAADQHGQHQGEVSAHATMAVATQRNVQIVAQPGRQRDVPASPEVRKPDRRVGKTEVVRHGEAQTECRADGGGRVAGEIAEDLAAEGQGADPRVQCAGRQVGVKYRLRGRGQKTIGQHDLLEQAQRHQRQTKTQLLARCPPRRLELRQQLAGAHDRSGHQMREKGHEQREIQQRAAGLCAPQVHI